MIATRPAVTESTWSVCVTFMYLCECVAINVNYFDKKKKHDEPCDCVRFWSFEMSSNIYIYRRWRWWRRDSDTLVYNRIDGNNTMNIVIDEQHEFYWRPTPQSCVAVAQLDIFIEKTSFFFRFFFSAIFVFDIFTAAVAAHRHLQNSTKTSIRHINDSTPTISKRFQSVRMAHIGILLLCIIIIIIIVWVSLPMLLLLLLSLSSSSSSSLPRCFIFALSFLILFSLTLSRTFYIESIARYIDYVCIYSARIRISYTEYSQNSVKV